MLTLKEFRSQVDLSRMAICEAVYARHHGHIQVKKKPTALRNLARIIDATLALANRTGFQAMTLRDLSRHSGLSMGALYAYIGSKEELVRLIQEYGRDLTARVLCECLEGIEDPEQRFRTAIRAWVYLTDALQDWFFFSFMEARHLGKEQMEAALQGDLRTEEVFRDIILDGQARGLFEAVNPELTAAGINALLQDWYLKRWKYRRLQMTAEAYADHVIGMVEPSLRKSGTAVSASPSAATSTE